MVRHNLEPTIQAFCYHPLGTLLVGDRCFVNEREYKRDFVDKVVALSYQRALIGTGEGTHLDLSSQDENSLFPSAASQRLWYDPWVYRSFGGSQLDWITDSCGDRVGDSLALAWFSFQTHLAVAGEKVSG